MDRIKFSMVLLASSILVRILDSRKCRGVSVACHKLLFDEIAMPAEHKRYLNAVKL